MFSFFFFLQSIPVSKESKRITHGGIAWVSAVEGASPSKGKWEERGRSLGKEGGRGADFLGGLADLLPPFFYLLLLLIITNIIFNCINFSFISINIIQQNI
uniref:Uncharacterized protein n=1 Tax=Caulerpa manorensis TaxID=717648 RepID=A0A2P0QIE7_9CHLO|nr:hypothetical protein [Caulerpa manorensis]ARO74520.1 hypothetical protein [Caulerpa manorensis]